jgi:ribosomal protein S18 acetylase RimI-like enzyme
VRDNRSALLAYLSDESSGVWVAYVGGEPAGCILLRPLPNLPESSEIKRLYVRPAYRGYGIASSLVTEIEGFAARRGISTLYLDTKDDLVEAIAFYRKHGYQPCARYNDNPQATIFMRKSIRPA